MIAFIGVRISWLIVARNALLASFACVGRFPRLPDLVEQAGVLDRDRGLLREPDEEVQVVVGERGVGAASRQTAIIPITVPRAISGAAIRRSSTSSSVPGMSHAARVAVRRR